MQIDWVTVIAQILNFLVLVWLLNRVLYRPVTRALEDRAEAVRTRLSEAEEAREKAEAEEERLRAEREQLEAHREEKRAEIDESLEEHRREMTEQARAEIAGQRADWARQLERERESFLARLRERAGEALTRLLARALGDLADADLEARVAAVFARKLEHGAEETRTDLARAAEAAEQPPRIVSAFEPGEETRARLRAAARAAIGAEAAERLVFETDPGLGCGIALEAGSRRIAWTIGAYVDALEEEIAATLDTAPGTDDADAAQDGTGPATGAEAADGEAAQTGGTAGPSGPARGRTGTGAGC